MKKQFFTYCLVVLVLTAVLSMGFRIKQEIDEQRKLAIEVALLKSLLMQTLNDHALAAQMLANKAAAPYYEKVKLSPTVLGLGQHSDPFLIHYEVIKEAVRQRPGMQWAPDTAQYDYVVKETPGAVILRISYVIQQTDALIENADNEISSVEDLERFKDRVEPYLVDLHREIGFLQEF